MQETDQVAIVPITGLNVRVFERLVQCYEAEFSAITGKVPDADGLFPLDTHLDEDHVGYLLYCGGVPAGFNIIAVKPAARFEVCEFYILPVFRLRRLGYLLAAEGFERHNGAWEVKQIAGADHATHFWRRAIGRYTDGTFAEDRYQDPYWGVVTRQTFCNS